VRFMRGFLNGKEGDVVMEEKVMKKGAIWKREVLGK